MKKYEIWKEGFLATGQSQGASKIGMEYGNNFDEAVKNFKSKNPWRCIEENDRNSYVSDDDYKNRRSNWNIWGCELFDNETDAREFEKKFQICYIKRKTPKV